jgi:uncharacterized protein (TIGR03083 family)
MTIPLPPADYLPHLSRQTAEFERLLRTADLDAPVVSCGDWTLRKLGAHLGNVHRWATTIVTTGEPASQNLELEPGGDLADWYAAGAAELLATLRGADPSAPAWHFSVTEKVKAFWFRRQAQEAAVHLFDAARAAGVETVIDPLIAADGVDEVFAVMMPRARRRSGPPPLPESLTIRATDTGHTWLLSPATQTTEGPTADLVAGDTVAAATVAAPAQDLLLLLWKRLAPADTAVRISGNEASARDFLAATLTP